MPKISELDYVSEIDATSYLLGIKGGAAVRIPASVLQGDDPIVNVTFIGQSDTPSSYTGQAGKMAAVNGTEDALEFIDAPTSLPAGGTTGQVLTKNSAIDGDAGWAEASGGTEIAVGTTAPTSPVDGQLWLDESQGVQDQNNFIDVTNLATDYPLRRGETAVVNYSGATSVPLHIKTVEGVYEVSIIGTQGVTISNDNNSALSPNNTTFSSAVKRQTTVSCSTTTSSVAATESNFATGAGNVLLSNISIQTHTSCKVAIIKANIKLTNGYYTYMTTCTWEDNSTIWSSLGTVTFPFAQSGTIVIRRIY